MAITHPGTTEVPHPTASIRLECYGNAIIVESVFPNVTSEVAHDFSYFVRRALPAATEQKPSLRLRVHDASGAPIDWKPYVSTSGSTLFRSQSGERRVCFFGKAWVSYRFEEGFAEIWCEDATIAYEVAYLVILSYVGERLDRRGMHRIHGLGLAAGERGVILLAQAGGGKSTLALHLLQMKGGPGILSDDTPLVTADGKMHAFPQRIALRERPAVPSAFVRAFKRVRHGEKAVVSSDFFRDRICDSARVGWLVLLKRSSDSVSKLDRVGRWRIVAPLARWLVLGHETPQIWQLFLRPSPKDFLAKARILWSRSRVAVKLLFSCEAYALTTSVDPAESARSLNNFLEGAR